MPENKNEIGRELKVSELQVGTVVVIAPPGKNAYITMWVLGVDKKMVVFYAGAAKPSLFGMQFEGNMRWTVLNFVQPDGSLHDDQGRLVRVFEYLGEI